MEKRILIQNARAIVSCEEKGVYCCGNSYNQNPIAPTSQHTNKTERIMIRSVLFFTSM